MKSCPTIQCSWNGSCVCEFVDEREFRRHCIEHIEAKIVAARAQRKIRLLVENWTEVLGGCGLESLTERVSLTHRLFHAIARPLLDGPKGRQLPRMALTKAAADNSKVVLVKRIKNGDGQQPPWRLIEVPIAEVPPPQNVTGFVQIRLKFFDANVLSFLRTVRPLLSNVWLALATGEGPWEESEQHGHYNWEKGSERHNLAVLECLLREFPNMDITRLDIKYTKSEDLMSADLFARVLTNVRILRIQCQLPAPASPLSLFGAYSRHCSPHIPVLVKWLHEPLGDGQPKLARLDIGHLDSLAALIAQAHEHFLSATTNSTVVPIPYFVILHSTALSFDSVQLPFATLHNQHSGEVLSLRRPLGSVGRCNNIVLCRRSCASPLAPDEQIEEEAQFLSIVQEFLRAMFHAKWCNVLTLNVAQVDEINETRSVKGPIKREGMTRQDTSRWARLMNLCRAMRRKLHN